MPVVPRALEKKRVRPQARVALVIQPPLRKADEPADHIRPAREPDAPRRGVLVNELAI